MNADKALIRQTVYRIIVRLYLKDNYTLLSVLYDYVSRNGDVFDDLMDPDLDIRSEWIGDKLKITVTINE